MTTTTTFETLIREQMIAMDIPAGWVIAVEEDAAHDDRFTLVLVNETVARSAERKLEPHCRRSCLDTYFKPIAAGARQGNRLAMRLKSRRAFDDRGRCDQWDDAPAVVDRTPIRQADRDRLQKGLAMTSTIDLIHVEHSDLEPQDVVAYAFGGERYTLLREVSRYEFEVSDGSGAIMTRRFYNPNAAFMVWGGPKLVAAQVDQSLIQKKPVGWHWIGDKLGSADLVATGPKSSEVDQQEKSVNGDVVQVDPDDNQPDEVSYTTSLIISKPSPYSKFLHIISVESSAMLDQKKGTWVHEKLGQSLMDGFAIQSVVATATCVVYTLINQSALDAARSGVFRK